MRRWMLAAAIVAAIGPSGFAEDGVSWVASYEEGLKGAKESGKLLMIDFFTSW